MERLPRLEDEVVTCFRDGTVTLRKNRRTSGFTESLKEIGYQGIRKGDLVIHQMDAFAGAIGVSDSNGKATPVYSACQPKGSQNTYFYAYIVREMAKAGFILSLTKGIRERSTDFRFGTFASQFLPVPPPIEEQDQIVEYVKRKSAQMNKFIRAKRRLLQLLVEKRQVATNNAIRLPETRKLRLGVVAKKMERQVERSADSLYTPVGLYNRGRGIFHKKSTRGNELGDSNFFWIKEGYLVISGQFAWEGAVSLAQKQDYNCIASHRYPIFRSRAKFVESAYLMSFFQSELGNLILNLNSRGAAGRNRPLNARTLMKEKIPIPPLHAQRQFTELLDFEVSVSNTVKKLVKLLVEYQTRLITDVVTGKVDVRDIPVEPVEDIEEIEELEGIQEREELTELQKVTDADD